jgi:uncharacterized membrane protein
MIAQLLPSPWEVHPALVHFPIAFLLGGVALDLFAWRRLRRQKNLTEIAPGLRALTQFATGLLIAGVLAGVPAVVTGFVAYVTAPLYVADSNILWHLGVSLSSLTLFAWVAFMRWLDWASSPTVVTRVTGLVAAVLLAAGAALGGHLVYRGGAAGFTPGLFGPAAGQSETTSPLLNEAAEPSSGSPSQERLFPRPRNGEAFLAPRPGVTAAVANAVPRRPGLAVGCRRDSGPQGRGRAAPNSHPDSVAGATNSGPSLRTLPTAAPTG